MYSKKTAALILLYLAFSLSIDAQQDDGIRFISDAPFDEVLQEAKRTGKNIFVDCFAVWCGPCKMLARDTFSLKEVGDYFNSNFINVQYDIEKGDGLNFFNKYKEHVPGVPTLLLVSPDGEILHSIVGFRDGTSLINEAKKGVSGGGLLHLEKRYLSGERGLTLVSSYVKALQGAYKNKEAEQVAKEFLSCLPVESLLNEDIWEIASPYIVNPYSSAYRFVINNSRRVKNQFKGNLLLFENQLNSGMNQAVNHLLPRIAKNELDEASTDSLQVLQELLYRYELKNSSAYLTKIEMAKIKREGDAQKMYHYLSFANKLKLLDDDKAFLKEIYAFIADHIEDDAILSDCFMQVNSLQEQENSRRLPVNFYAILSQLSKKLGKKEEAEFFDELFQRLEKRNNEKINSVR
ncbi:MAG: thioredoxin family protein [Fermentimonas sp.]|jgi:thiol-disulfide isomerase/thioredoxin